MSQASRKFVKSLIRYRATDHEENYETYKMINDLLDKAETKEERMHILYDKH